MNCAKCGCDRVFRTVRAQTYGYKGRSLTLDQPGSWCPRCGEGVLTAEDVNATENSFNIFKSYIDSEDNQTCK